MSIVTVVALLCLLVSLKTISFSVQFAILHHYHMDMIAVFAVLGLVLTATAAATVHIDITGGESVASDKVPSYIAMLTADLPSTGVACTGSLISPSYILTAAHCASTIQWALLGAYNASGSDAKERIRLVKRTNHPKFEPIDLYYDFALYQLATPSKLAPVAISWEEDSFNGPGVIAWIRGYGQTNSQGAQPTALQQAQVQIWSNDDCSRAENGRKVDRVSNICAGGSKQDTCNGDSGGPLTVMKNGQEQLIGVTSWGSLACAVPGIPGVYARISAAKSFINSVIPRLECIVRPSLKFSPLSYALAEGCEG
ncbi:unnamed protein product [Aphanomyces euteiches]